MLNVPEVIKTLFKTDSVRKNFRVIFPNGECTDLTNDDIVAGTVQFTESICSKDVLQFGLAESSRIQFECVNVPNVYGATIECAIEIDTSSLSPADITSIQANQGDGVLVLENDSDIGFGYYRVPYGTFTITSCPRSSGAMWKRRVEAYENTGSTGTTRIKIPQFLTYKYNAQNWQNTGVTTMVQNIPLLMANINNSIAGLTVTETESPITNLYGSIHFVEWDNNGTKVRVSFTRSSGDVYRGYSSGLREVTDSVYRLTCDIDDTTILPILERMKELNAPQDCIESVRAVLTVGYNMADLLGGIQATFPFDNTEDTGYFYPYSNSVGGYAVNVNTGGYDKIVIRIYETPNVVENYYISNVVSNCHLYRYQLTDADKLNMNITLKATGNWYQYNTYTNAIDFDALVESYTEMHAQFRKDDRHGNAEYITLSKSSPYAVSADDYASLWWDEFDISPIGSILVAYNDIDVGQEQTLLYTFGDGLSTYDMTKNYMFKNMTVSASNLSNQTVEEYVKSLLDTYFIPNVQDIAFTPVQLDALGLPFLESGDYLEIDDGNNGTVGTYIMNHTISGEQLLMDDVESKGGEIIGNVRSA